ncbi:hypothetical protein ACFYPK_19565 [Streptomyces halstedii]|uniref:hypothetical protein n=1 Tax=Streptomyces TaxID=1883 RepID=UPI0004A99B31|nr:hypothetical protein [Streptomyces sp. NTK 937]KDQ71286.1 hypothetical protein DT87_30045 [Streptomyces sp. NTK 937]WSX34317.1 hypothetical protein OG291_00935 [Streptomyces halstedii]
MTPGTGSSTRTREPRSGAPGRLGTGVCALVLSLGALVTGYVVLTAYMIEPDGPWDTQAVTNSKVAGGVGLALSALTAPLTWLFVRAEWLRKWWYAIPAALAVAALLRLTLLAPSL